MKKIGVGSLIKSSKTNRCLFILRNDRSFNGQFGLVGGKVKKNENVIEALVREIAEEIGFIPDIEKIVRFNDFISDDNKFYFYSCLIIVKEEFIPNLNNESSGYAWTSVYHLPKPMHPRVKELLKNDIVLNSIDRF